MAETRVFLAQSLSPGAELELEEAARRHLVQVLRGRPGERFVAFNGQGGEYELELSVVEKRRAMARVLRFVEVDRESPRETILVQGVSRGERMDWTLQKAVELGVSRVVPVLTERCNVNLAGDRSGKRLEHWRGVVRSACEQSGRTRVPVVEEARPLAQWWAADIAAHRWVLDPIAAGSFPAGPWRPGAVSLVVGPEGGLSPEEIALGSESGARPVRLGRRILRSETAGPVALALVQAVAGDLLE